MITISLRIREPVSKHKIWIRCQYLTVREALSQSSIFRLSYCVLNQQILNTKEQVFNICKNLYWDSGLALQTGKVPSPFEIRSDTNTSKQSIEYLWALIAMNGPFSTTFKLAKSCQMYDSSPIKQDLYYAGHQ